jgi:Protein of unknown function (DUF3563)
LSQSIKTELPPAVDDAPRGDADRIAPKHSHSSIMTSTDSARLSAAAVDRHRSTARSIAQRSLRARLLALVFRACQVVMTDDRSTYLSRATDLADLERRLRALDRSSGTDWR